MVANVILVSSVDNRIELVAVVLRTKKLTVDIGIFDYIESKFLRTFKLWA